MTCDDWIKRDNSLEIKLTNANKQNLLVCDTAYTYEFLTERNLQAFVTWKDLDGYFDNVWTVHAVASLFFPKSSEARYGPPIVRKLNERHTHIEGKIGRFKKLAWFPALNFILAQLELIWLLLKLIKQNHIKIIRAEDAWFNGLLGLILSYAKRLPLVTGVWGNPDVIRKTTKQLMSSKFKWLWLEKTVERFVLRRSNIVLSQNYDNRDFVLRQGVKKNKTVITRIGSALDAVHFVAPGKRESGNADLKEIGVAGEIVLLCIFRLESMKLPDHLVRIVALLKDRGHDVKGVFVGDGSMREELVILSKKLGVFNQIVFCGNKDQFWLSRVIPLVSVVVSTLTGRSLAEAALGGAPIVAYDIDWQDEAIETGVTGELVPYSDYLSMTISVEKILNDHGYGKGIGANARERMLKMMDPKANDKILKDVYEELLKPKFG